MRVLGIETSCDETGLAVYDNDAGLLSHALYSQVELHKTYGGVVPELASRDHIRRVIPLIREVLNNAGLDKDQLDGIAYTAGPGLIGALLVGVAIGQGLAYGLGKPAIGIHHMEGHLLAPMLEAEAPGFPFIALLVSGGHTQLVRVNRPFDYLMLGQSMDDAAGEALDKTAKLLGLPYPGGPELARLAETGDPDRFRFPRPMTNRPGLDFSFSGLKTYAINTYQAHRDDPDIAADIARAFLEAVVDTLSIKCKRAMEVTGIKTIVAAGGVSANKQLRQSLDELAAEVGGRVYYPRTEFCTDNGAMIAYAGSLRLAAGELEPLSFTARPRWPLC